jgi:hypothetical protein
LELQVDPGSRGRPISRDIYGINEMGDTDGKGNLAGLSGKMPFGARRWGGDSSVSYNWMLDSYNTASNWFFETFPMDAAKDRPVDAALLPDGSSFDQWVQRNKANGVTSVATVPIIGWTTSTRTPKRCSYEVSKYGPQQSTDVWAPNCGNGMSPNGKTAVQNDPHDVYVEAGPDFAAQWVAHVVAAAGSADNGGVRVWELDNEPTWWHAVHRDIHPQYATFDEVLDRNARWAAAIKSADPTALVGGATPPGWESYFYSARDLYAGWGTGPDWKYWNNPSDCRAHSEGGGCVGFIPWYLSQMRALEQQTGQRLIDYLDIHAYVAPDGMPEKAEAAKPEIEALRLRSTRTFWDPDYMPPRADMIGMDNKWKTGTPQIVPRMKAWIDTYYPGTRLAITEYNWGAQGSTTGALGTSGPAGDLRQGGSGPCHPSGAIRRKASPGHSRSACSSTTTDNKALSATSRWALPRPMRTWFPSSRPCERATAPSRWC